jgi:hypothetical protein
MEGGGWEREQLKGFMEKKNKKEREKEIKQRRGRGGREEERKEHHPSSLGEATRGGKGPQ